MTPSTRTRSDRRLLLAFSAGAVSLIVAIWVFIGLQERLGLDTEAARPVLRTGTAEVRSCSAAALDVWMTYRCDAEVRWNGEKDTVSQRFRSVRAVSGTVDVQLRSEGTDRAGKSTSKLVIADYPHWDNGFLFFFLMMCFVVGGFALGTAAGYFLGKLLPPPPPEKLVLTPFQKERRRQSKRRKR